MTDTQKSIEAKARSLARLRQDIDAEIKKLEEQKSMLTKELVAALVELGETRIRPTKDGAGYVLQRPTKTVWNEDYLREALSESAPKVLRRVFKKHVEYRFDEEALSKAIDKGDVPNADDILADERVVRIMELSPRLMPLKAKSVDTVS